MANYLIDGLFKNIDTLSNFAELEHNRRYTYQDVLDVSAQFANVLVESGLQPGDRVAVQIPKSIEAIMLYLATIRAGGVFLPLNTMYTTQEVEYFLGDAKPHTFVCAPENEEAYKRFTVEHNIRLETMGIWVGHQTSAGSLLDSGLWAEREFRDIPRKKTDLAAILYTSGTTGQAKGVMLSHENLLSNAQTLVKFWQFTDTDVLLHALPIYHTHGLFVATNISLLAAGAMIFLPKFDVTRVIEELPKATSMMGVPTYYTRLLEDSRFTRELVSHIRVFISGSAPLLVDTHTAFQLRTGHSILERYGMTETSMITSNPYDGLRKPGTVGVPLPGVEVRVANSKSGKVVKDGETGILEVRGPNVFQGYWNLAKLTKQEFRKDGFFITGDMGMIADEGYIQLVGRAKDLIISGGENIYPKELEILINAQDNVEESAVIGVPHPDLGEAVVGILVPKKGTTLNENEISKAIKFKIARFKLPKRIFVVEELPRNAMGKVLKTELRKEYKQTFAKGTS